MKKQILLITLVLFSFSVNAQLKTVVEDFEGYADGQTEMSEEGIYSYGDASLMTLQHITTGYGYSGNRALRIQWAGKKWHGGWGIGVGAYKELNVRTDYFNFYIWCPKIDSVEIDRIKISLEDDDNNNTLLNSDKYDIWYYDLTVQRKNEWQLISIPLEQFIRGNFAGDGEFNLSSEGGVLRSIGFSFEDVPHYTPQHFWYFDFISFSKGRLNTQNDIFLLPPGNNEDYCALGAWSKSDYELNYLLIAKDFENNFNCNSPMKQLSAVSFYKPFSTDGMQVPNIYPSKEDLDILVSNGYLPMITLEAKYAKLADSTQPNLYSIVEGHLDYFISDWARRLKEVKSPVFLRVLHEFNGNWYPWCIANNDNDPKLFIKAYRHIRQLFWNEKADNVKFVWCPNSMSIPQASWNFIMDAYPGNEYVDVVGLDVFNGAGEQKENVWHSFRKIAADNYFIIKENIPEKPFIICEVSSRERTKNENGYYEGKDTWIQQMAEGLKTDFSDIRFLVWFNQYDNFRVNSSSESGAAYLQYIWTDNYFNQK